MFKKLLTLVLAVLMLMAWGSLTAQDSLSVTFNVNLKVKTAEGVFIPGTDNVTLRGGFMDEIGLSGDWFPDEGALLLSDVDSDTVYSLTIKMPAANDGETFEFKYAINDAMWEGDPNRSFVLADDLVLPAVWFDRDSIVTVMVTNTLNFTADLTDIYGSGDGFFDPDQDSLLVMGLDWVGATVESGARKFVEDPFSPGVFKTSMVIKGVEGDSTKWKCKAYPDEHFFNWGWEVTSDKWHHIQEDGAVIEIGPFKPDVFPEQDPLAADVQVLFQVDMTNAVNQWNDAAINPSDLIFVGLKGQNDVLGAWGGAWLPSDTVSTDTTDATLLVLNDNGVNGDKTAGDDVWSLLVTFPAGNGGGPSLYKYAAHYPGADTLNNGENPLNNEWESGVDHYVNIKEGQGLIELVDHFGVYMQTSSVERIGNAVPDGFTLSQNYPNPFNPETTIRYAIPKNTRVTLKVYNTLGREVATLVDQNQAAGEYAVSFKAVKAASGVYFYKLTTGNHVSVKRMLLVK